MPTRPRAALQSPGNRRHWDGYPRAVQTRVKEQMLWGLKAAKTSATRTRWATAVSTTTALKAGQLQKTRVNAVAREGQNLAVGGRRAQRIQDRIEILRDLGYDDRALVW